MLSKDECLRLIEIHNKEAAKEFKRVLAPRHPTVEIPNKMYPVAAIQDRYNGCYSGGAWVAVSNLTSHLNELEEGPFNADPEAAAFWNSEPNWIGAGATPDLAIESLLKKHIADET